MGDEHTRKKHPQQLDLLHKSELEPAEANNMYRYGAYRQFSRFIYGRLGKTDRRMAPSCVTHAIREEFPAAHYTGFKNARTSALVTLEEYDGSSESE